MRRSDNAAANPMIDRIGLRRIEAVVVDPSCRFYDPDQGGGIWLGRRFHDKFVSVMERSIPLAHLYRKTGTWHAWYSVRFGPRPG